MLKALAVLRTIFLVFLTGYTVRTLPWGWSRTFDEEFARRFQVAGERARPGPEV